MTSSAHSRCPSCGLSIHAPDCPSAAWRDEFERRIKLLLLPSHAEHDTSSLTIKYIGYDGSGCETCGSDPEARIAVTGACGCGDRVYGDQNLASDDFGTFMARLTADASDEPAQDR